MAAKTVFKAGAIRDSIISINREPAESRTKTK